MNCTFIYMIKLQLDSMFMKYIPSCLSISFSYKPAGSRLKTIYLVSFVIVFSITFV